MARFLTKYFGWLDWPEQGLILFPSGLPAFERERRFARLELERYAPLVFLQSLSTPELCFLATPVTAVDPSYVLDQTAPAHSNNPAEVLVLLTVPDNGPPAANLLAPVVIAQDRVAVQAIRYDRRYASRHPLEGTVCAERLMQCL